MGLDINLFRKEKGGDPDLVKESVRRRAPTDPEAPKIVDQIVQADVDWRKFVYNTEQLKKDLNKVQKDIGIRKKDSKGEDKCEDLLEIKNQLDQQIIESTKISDEAAILRDSLLGKVGNLVHDSVPVELDEQFNRVERTWGECRKIDVTSLPGFCNHHKVLAMIDGYDPKRGNKVAGHRGYFLKGYGALLNMALVQYGMQFLFKKKYTPIQTPFFMRKEIMAETCQLSDFDETLYKLGSKEGTEDKDEKYLIATSEQPISGYYRNEWLTHEELENPIRFAGFSTCFRKEAGSTGRDMWGIFRVHQFEKIEQFVVCKPEDSWEEHERMTAISEEFLQSLGLPYRVISIVSGALNDAAAKKYDIEAWFPGYGEYKELVSCSNCTDYQSRALEIRIRPQKTQKTDKDCKNEFVHMLNGTLVATERTLCCILENNQTEEGVRVPEVLIPYVGTDFIPYDPKAVKAVQEEDALEAKNAKK